VKTGAEGVGGGAVRHSSSRSKARRNRQSSRSQQTQDGVHKAVELCGDRGSGKTERMKGGAVRHSSSRSKDRRKDMVEPSRHRTGS
jgi:hypothetical protein